MIFIHPFPMHSSFLVNKLEGETILLLHQGKHLLQDVRQGEELPYSLLFDTVQGPKCIKLSK